MPPLGDSALTNIYIQKFANYAFTVHQRRKLVLASIMLRTRWCSGIKYHFYAADGILQRSQFAGWEYSSGHSTYVKSVYTVMIGESSLAILCNNVEYKTAQ